ncbi:MAG: TAXI family TRAP transporter solute-binding subunit [Planctomycetes bacterium]|nr:TAXI family TRAP transporter solute-binding subunit [Planctomycetota bacterium]MCB9891719.1 TAXI family TRAP transporter solute-binding subunit [Planctomycetota bacterium]
MLDFDTNRDPSTIRRPITHTLLLGLLVALPFLAFALYRHATAWPEHVVIAAGPAGGRYRELGDSLARELRTRGVTVDVLETSGSVENLERLQAGTCDLALHQAGTHSLVTLEPGIERPRFVVNLGLQPVQIVVRADAPHTTLSDLAGRKVGVGLEGSGNEAMATFLFDCCEFGDARPVLIHGSYEELAHGLLDGTLDALVWTIRVDAPACRALYASGRVRLLDVPFAEALAQRHLFLDTTTMPRGLCHPLPPVPDTPTTTLSLGTHLLARESLPDAFVEELTKIAYGRGFQSANGLRELSDRGVEFGRLGAEHDLHPGASAFYEPHLKPLLDPDFVEATEGLRSFVVSIGIALFLLWRWVRDRRRSRQEHALDGYFRKLLSLERREMSLARDTEDTTYRALENLLREVSTIRQDALTNFSMNDLQQDGAVDCLLEMCHFLSQKLAHRLTTHRLDRLLQAGAS